MTGRGPVLDHKDDKFNWILLRFQPGRIIHVSDARKKSGLKMCTVTVAIDSDNLA